MTLLFVAKVSCNSAFERIGLNDGERQSAMRALRKAIQNSVLIAALVWPATGASADSVSDDLRAVLEAGDYQTELPDPPPPRDRPDPPSPDLPDIDGSNASDFAELLSYFALAILAAVVLTLIVREVQRFQVRRSQSGDRRIKSAARPAPAIDRKTAGGALSDADSLAAAGRFAEAIHLLLLTGIDALSKRAEAETDPARTSREILEIAPLADTSRNAFAALIRAVEHAHFAARPADRAMFLDCRASFERFVAAEHGGRG